MERKKIIPILILCLALLLAMTSCALPGTVKDESESSSSPATETESSTSVPETEPASETAAAISAPFNKPTQVLSVDEAFESYSFQDSETGKILPFRLYLPDGYDENGAYPVLLFLHGAGQRGTDNVQHITYALPGLFNDLDSPVYGAIVVCPQCPPDEQWVDTPYSQGSYRLDDVPISPLMHAVVELMHYITECYAVDENRLYVTGLSIGGFGTWDICLRNPDLFAAAIPVCGGGSPHDADEIAHLPIVTVHGDADTSVPVTGTREMVEELRNAGSDVIYHELKGYRHNVWDWTYSNPEIINWLFAQVKTTNG